MSTNGISTNGMSTNGMSTNGVSTNGMSTNGMHTNGMSDHDMSDHDMSDNNTSDNTMSDISDSSMYDKQEELDNLVWDKNEEDEEEAQARMHLLDTCHKVEELVEQTFGMPATFVRPVISGGFNVLYRVRIEEMSPPDLIVRLPCPSLVPFPEDKIMQEAATATFIARHTQLPIPRNLFCGRDSIVGPFIIMEHVENGGSVSARLTRPGQDPSVPHVLDSNVPDTTLEVIWGNIAYCMLQLSRMTFPRIGSLVVDVSQATYYVADRPITQNMTDMIRLANIPSGVLPPEGKTYETADEWYTALADMHIAQLTFQHNDAVTCEDNCRNKYVARQIFRRLARQGRLSVFGFAEDNWSADSSKIPAPTLLPAPSSRDSFRLWGDDFRAGNILLTDGGDDIAALIDWECTYAGPTQFILDPPWWLLIESAEKWSSGMDDWVETYEARLSIWLSAMEKAEADAMEPSFLPAPLSAYMRESWETGRFHLNYGARKSWAFDAMYWKFLDERFFGDRERGVAKKDLWRTRVHLLSEEEREAMEPFVERKMDESEERRIVNWDASEARQRLSELLFD